MYLSGKKAGKQSPVSRQKGRKTMLLLLSIQEAAAGELWWIETQLLCFRWQCAVLKPFIMLYLCGGSHWKLYQPSHNSHSAMETCCGGSVLKDSIAHTLTNLSTLKKTVLWLRGFETCTSLARSLQNVLITAPSFHVLKWLMLPETMLSALIIYYQTDASSRSPEKTPMMCNVVWVV